MQPIDPRHILITRTDSIGDVVLTLPLVGALRRAFPDARISFLGRSYTEAVIRSCAHIDAFLNWDELASHPQSWEALHADCAIHALPDPLVMEATARAGVPIRIATAGRLASWMHATHRIWFSRKRSGLHESQLNFRLLTPLGIREIPALDSIALLYGLTATEALPPEVGHLAADERIKVILHPLSKGSAANWGLAEFKTISELLPEDRFVVFVTGTQSEGDRIRTVIKCRQNHVHDLTGMLTLGQLLMLIQSSDALVAASTGPLHLAAALGKKAIGLFTPKRPMHAGRWAPVGTLSEVCVATKHPKPGETLAIDPVMVARRLLVFSEEKV